MRMILSSTYLSLSPAVSTNQTDAVTAVENCIRDIRQWMLEVKLMLNDDKTEVLLNATLEQLAKTSIESIRRKLARSMSKWSIQLVTLEPGSTPTLQSIRTLIGPVAVLFSNIERIHKYLTSESATALVHALITSRVDHRNSLYYGLPDNQLHELQRVLNSSAPLVLFQPRFCHVTPLLRELYWLPVRSRIEFKLLLITFKVLKGLAPLYLSELISVLPPSSYNLRRNYNGTLLCTPKFKSKRTLGDRAFSSAAPALWNSSPLAIRNVEQSIESFKNKLKTHSFTRVFTE